MTSIQSKACVSHEYIISLAKDVLRPYHCEWGTCPTVLNSWRAYEKHVSLHCKHVTKTKGTTGKCEWRTCLFRVPTSTSDLLKHVESSHLSHVPLWCPLRDCSQPFPHHELLPEHFFNMHHTFQRGCAPDVLSPFTRQTARLTAPPSQNLPPLPNGPILCILLNEACSSLRQKPLQRAIGLSQSQNVIGHGRKRRRGRLEERGHARQVPSKQDHTTDDESEVDECHARVADIDHDNYESGKLESRSRFLVRRRVTKSWTSVEKELGAPSVPRLTGEPPLKKSPLSFGFAKVSEDPSL